MESHAPVNDQGDVAAAKEGIREFNRSAAAAFRNQDAAAMAALWMANGRILPPGQEMVTGRAAVQTFLQSVFDQGAYEIALESPEIGSLGDGVAYEIGRHIVRMRTADGLSIDVPAKSLCIYRREDDGVWRVDIDIFNEMS
jgi:uncharacterized protein (TIGR02246 family)